MFMFFDITQLSTHHTSIHALYMFEKWYWWGYKWCKKSWKLNSGQRFQISAV